MFQSLTGRLKTADDDDARGVLEKFQSLTGRLKTFATRLRSTRMPRFQSLTGRLKTNPHTPLGAGF